MHAQQWKGKKASTRAGIKKTSPITIKSHAVCGDASPMQLCGRWIFQHENSCQLPRSFSERISNKHYRHSTYPAFQHRQFQPTYMDNGFFAAFHDPGHSKLRTSCSNFLMMPHWAVPNRINQPSELHTSVVIFCTFHKKEFVVKSNKVLGSYHEILYNGVGFVAQTRQLVLTAICQQQKICRFVSIRETSSLYRSRFFVAIHVWSFVQDFCCENTHVNAFRVTSKKLVNFEKNSLLLTVTQEQPVSTAVQHADGVPSNTPRQTDIKFDSELFNIVVSHKAGAAASVSPSGKMSTVVYHERRQVHSPACRFSPLCHADITYLFAMVTYGFCEFIYVHNRRWEPRLTTCQH